MKKISIIFFFLLASCDIVYYEPVRVLEPRMVCNHVAIPEYGYRERWGPFGLVRDYGPIGYQDTIKCEIVRI